MSWHLVLVFLTAVAVCYMVGREFINAFGDKLRLPGFKAQYHLRQQWWLDCPNQHSYYWKTVVLNAVVESVLGFTGLHVLSYLMAFRLILFVICYRRSLNYSEAQRDVLRRRPIITRFM